MMLYSILSRYIFKQIVWSVFIVLLVVLSLDALSRVIEQTSDMQGSYTFVQLLYYIALTLPGRLVEYMPFAALIGCLIGMGVLTNNNELIVARSAGMSVWKLVCMALVPIMLIMLSAMFVAEFVVPKLDQHAERQRLEKRYAKKSLFASHQFWSREKNEFIRIDNLTYDGNIIGLTRYIFNQNWQLVKTQYSKKATFEKGVWNLENSVETNFIIDQETGHVKELNKTIDENSIWQSSVDARQLRYLILDPDDLNIIKLSKFTKYLESQNLNVEHYKLSFWAKVFYPLIAIGLILIAIPGVFGSTRQVSIGYRIFVGVLIGVMFRMVQNLLTPTALVYDLSPLLLSILPIGLCFMIGVYRLKKC